MDGILISNISKKFNDIEVLKNVSMKCEANKVTCILGPSGCGKTTLLNIITESISDYDGKVQGYDKNKVAFIFQEDRLIEWLNIYENLSLVLKRKFTKESLKKDIQDGLKSIGMDKYLGFYPKELSGGMRQRISILRAFLYNGDLLIMDEPFKSLDIRNKKLLIDDFKKLRIKNKNTVIFVTHDLEEAIELSDKIYVFSDKPTKVKAEIMNDSNKDVKNYIRNLMLE